MAETDSVNAAKAQAFFERALQARGRSNFDYAIEMYLEGLRYDPDALEMGHLALYELALLRQGKEGKKPTMVERMKRLRGKNPLEQMLNAEYLFAKDPDHLPYAEAVLKAAVAGDYRKLVGWIANLVFQGNNAAKRPSVHTYILLKDAYKSIGQFDKAIVACQRASKLKPEDANLADEFKNLTAELTMSRGKYDQDGDFRNSIKDREVQEKLQSQKAVVKTDDYRQTAVDDARKDYALDPNLPKNIFNLAEALSEMQDDKGEKEAIELLERTYKAKDDFSYKQRAGQIQMKRIRRNVRKAKSIAESRRGDNEAKKRVSQWNAKLNSVELEHYRLCVKNYPTDLQAKYEYGTRLIRNKKYDDAIPLFQESQKDPRHKISSMDKIGLCFFYKGWYADAIDIFTQAIDAYEIKDDGIAKELRYNLARSYEQKGETAKALEIYRKIAQLDFGYRDVRQRVDQLRSQGSGPSTE
ncbi:MAG: tetratricopeptide repeat protein [Planctomycetota bacterium]|jgi:tetratricopeptide (TPR) repeat protein